MADHEDRSLIPLPAGSLANNVLGAQRILSLMIEETLALVRDAAVVPADLDALVSEGKRLYCSMVKGRGLHPGNLTEEDIEAFNL